MNRIIRGGIAGVALVGLGALIYSSYDKPVQQVAASVTEQAAQGRAIVEVSVPEFEGKAVLGQMAFVAKCAACHGENAVGQVGVAPPLVHKIYEPSHHGDMSFIMAARNGVRAHHWTFGNMPPIKGITDAEVGTIVAYIRVLQRANGIF